MIFMVIQTFRQGLQACVRGNYNFISRTSSVTLVHTTQNNQAIETTFDIKHINIQTLSTLIA